MRDGMTTDGRSVRDGDGIHPGGDGMMTDGDRPIRVEDGVQDREVGYSDRSSETTTNSVPQQRGQFGDRRVGGLGDRAVHGL